MMKTIKQAAVETGLSYSCIRQLCIENKIKFIRSGKKYYVNMPSLIEYCGGCGEIESAQSII